MTNRSKKAAHYGALAERAARERYGLEPAHSSWQDAETDDGRPVEVKSAMMNRRSGKIGRFRIFEDYHARLRREGGLYVFVLYSATGGSGGGGIRVQNMRSVDADALRLRFYSSGGHRDSQQIKIHPHRVFR
ncbi:HGPV1-ORF9-like protein [Haloferax volcanii]|nr:HGPV1-ORF9-like protein [Haloferax alexandrinus]